MLALLFIMAKNRRRLGVVRAGAFLLSAALVASLLYARHAKAEMASVAMRVGRDLAPLVHVLGDASTISLNGQPISIAYDGTKRSVRDVLDAADAACAAGGVEGVRSGDDREGVVLCFAKGSLTRASLAEQLASFANDGDLGALGKLRYVYARRDGDGTAALVATTADSFRLDALTPPSETDAPGADDPALPRPKASVRFLSARIEGTPYAVRGYRTRLGDEEVRADFRAGMIERGFTALDVVAKNGAKTSAFMKDGVIVTFATAKEGADTLVSIGTMGAEAAMRGVR